MSYAKYWAFIKYIRVLVRLKSDLKPLFMSSVVLLYADTEDIANQYKYEYCNRQKKRMETK